ncbi:MAG: Alpha subunit of succinyl-CoA ligase [Aureobasidium pullulans]|nr:MAG: Alpha subunit of succinyl-CoA ligase [Aureobasidium pullulans]
MSAEGETAPKVAIGISFGNSYSSIAYTSGEAKAEVIANELGDRQIPTVLSYVDGEEFQGTEAKSQLVRNPKNTVAYFRDFLGKDFKSIDPTNCHASAHPVDAENTIAFQIKDTEADQQNTRTIHEITVRHLRRLASSATDYLGKKVNAAIITIPSDFTDAQKDALNKAATEAGLEVLQFITEPVAALLAHDAKNNEESTKDKNVVVADIGGTRTDIALVASRGGMYTVLATAHDYELGGAQLDAALIDYAAKEFQKKNKTDPRTNERSLAKLKLEAEAVKKSLSLGASAAFSIESLSDGIDFSLTVNRTRYELLAGKVFSSFTRLIESAVQKAGLDNLEIDEILLSGGTSHTPKIASNVQSVFSESTIIAPSTNPAAVNPSELTVRGAAIQASLISEFEKEDVEQSTHPAVTVAPHLAKAIGVLVGDNEFVTLIDANTAVPVRRTAQLNAAEGDVLVKLCEGVSEIKVTKEEPAPKAEANGDDEDSDDDSDDEPEETREKVWKAGEVIAEAAVKDVKKGSKVEVQINVNADLSVQVIVREVGSKTGVRGTIEASA